MEQAQLGNSVRMPWEKPNPPVRRPTYTRRPTLGSRRPSLAQSIEVHRVRMLNWMPLHVKNHLVAALSEFAGTFMFLLFAFGGTNAVNTAPDEGQPRDLAANPAKLLFISLCFGMSLAVNAWVFFRISGGLFNPAVTIGMMVVGAVPYVRGILVIAAQIAGGIAASAVVLGILPGELTVATTLGGGTSIVQGLFIEIFLTAQLVFTIFMLAAEKHRGTFIAPIGIGLSLFIAELMGVYYTGGSLNPARSLGPSVVTASFVGYHWIYHAGPILGALLASGFYVVIKALEYETVNPEADAPGHGEPKRFGLPTINSNEGGEKPEENNHNNTNMNMNMNMHSGGYPARRTVSRGNSHVGYADLPNVEAGRRPTTASTYNDTRQLMS